MIKCRSRWFRADDSRDGRVPDTQSHAPARTAAFGWEAGALFIVATRTQYALLDVPVLLQPDRARLDFLAFEHQRREGITGPHDEADTGRTVDQHPHAWRPAPRRRGTRRARRPPAPGQALQRSQPSRLSRVTASMARPPRRARSGKDPRACWETPIHRALAYDDIEIYNSPREERLVPEAGGPATQAGIFYQNSVAAMALSELLNLDPRIPRERATEVRLEAPEDVDDIVVRFADDHCEFQDVKLRIRVGDRAWPGIWRDLIAQYRAATFGSHDQLILVVEKRTNDSEAVAALCERAASSIDEQELRGRLARPPLAALDSIVSILGSSTAAYELLRRTSVRHLPLAEIERELGRRRLAGGQSPPPTLLPILRDIAGGQARRRGLFQPAPLRRSLRAEHGLLLGEPPEWGLESYRATIKRLSIIEVPGMGVSGPAEELFVWPRTREYDRTRPAGFEDEDPALVDWDAGFDLDLKAFPNDRLDRVVVVAGPGYGKSALLTSIAGKLAEGPLVPVSIPLASLASADSSIISFLATSISQELDLTADWRQLAEQGLLILLLDGLDEVPSGRRPMLTQRITAFSARYPRAPWMLTVRDPAVATGLPEATVVELLPLNDGDIERFAEAMKNYLGDADGWRIVSRLKLYPELDRLARIPLFLMMLLATSDLKDHKAATRSDLIESYLKTLFSPAHHKPLEDQADRSESLRTIAETLAFERLERQEIGATEREVREVISRVSTSHTEEYMLLEQLKANGILKQQSSIRLQFPYPIVQEYLAACHLISCYSNSLEQRIEDAMQRPWAQVIQFALELHTDPEPIIRKMLSQPDDAFCTGLRLVGRCIANGATVSTALREVVGNRLVEYWVHAPSRSRERVGRLLADGYAEPPSDVLTAALHHRWLIQDGAGDIISKLNDIDLTLSVIDSIIENDHSGLMIYRSLWPAFRNAGDTTLRSVIDKMDPDKLDEDKIISISDLFLNFSPEAVSRELVLSVARDRRLPDQTRMRAYELAAPPLAEEGIALALKSFRHDDWDRHYEAANLVKVHANPSYFLREILLDASIPVERRRNLAADVAVILTDETTRRVFSQACVADSSLEEGIRLTLYLVEARFGDRVAFGRLVDRISQIPIKYAAATIALFGHYPERTLAEHAATVARSREMVAKEVLQMANSVSTGMLYVFEMDFGFGGRLLPASPHPGIGAWTELLEDWGSRDDLVPLGRLAVMTVATELGSERARANLEAEVFEIDHMDASEWTEEDEAGHALSRALREIRRRKPLLSKALIEKIVASGRFNIAKNGIDALQARADDDALDRLILLHNERSDWFLRDTIANAMELMAAK